MSQHTPMYVIGDIRPTYQYSTKFQEARHAKLARLALRFHEDGNNIA